MAVQDGGRLAQVPADTAAPETEDSKHSVSAMKLARTALLRQILPATLHACNTTSAH
jgi:hypothetical protein